MRRTRIISTVGMAVAVVLLLRPAPLRAAPGDASDNASWSAGDFRRGNGQRVRQPVMQ